jgi:hypothetical protein
MPAARGQHVHATYISRAGVREPATRLVSLLVSFAAVRGRAPPATGTGKPAAADHADLSEQCTAELEIVLGEIPQGFKSPILRQEIGLVS